MPATLQRNIDEARALFWSLLRGTVIGIFSGILAGIASAIFLLSLKWATDERVSHPWLLFLLPIAGLVIGWTYDRYGQSVASGNNLLLDRIHSEETKVIPFRMVPLVLAGTVITHLFGGSAGREGTAVQMGGALANRATKPLRLALRDHRVLIMSGISGGFGSVFGTPLAGTIFGLEVLSLGRVDYEALIPCFVASYVGDIVCRALGVHHSAYSVPAPLPHLTAWLWFLIVVASVLFAGAAILFSELTDSIAHFMKARITPSYLRPVFGGIAVIGLTYALNTRDYLGLSLPLIAQSFTPQGVVLWAFAAKILFTAITLGTGFKGGEVTPLFCIGATLGAAFAQVTGQSTGFFAALGFVAVFAGAANTPLACILMGIELFGAQHAVLLAVACWISYHFSGHTSIYSSQRPGVRKNEV